MRRLVLIISVALIAASSVAAKDWRGIFPMKSTLADVQRRFGFPKPTKDRLVVNNGRWIYFLNQEEVHFQFDVGHTKCATPIAEGTILKIYVRPMIQPLVSSMGLDEKRFSRFDHTFLQDPTAVTYINKEDGLLIQTSQGKVSEIIYLPSGSDRLMCPGFYGSLDGPLVPIVCGLAFDSFGDIRFADEKARLDNFAIQISNYKGAHGYIIVYAPGKPNVSQAQRRANRAKNYMVRVRGIESERLYAVDGGYSDQMEIKLYVAPPGAEPPPLTPQIKSN